MEKEEIELLGDNHVLTSISTPLRSDAFDKSADEKIVTIQHYLSGTPYRVAKMYVKELFYGLDPANKPKLSTFKNKYGYHKMLVEQNISLDSSCEHHFLPITGFAHIAYKPKEKVVGLSKINRLVDYYAHRPQVQERLCLQI
jgi:GTP cyclohydrolase I